MNARILMYPFSPKPLTSKYLTGMNQLCDWINHEVKGEIRRESIHSPVVQGQRVLLVGKKKHEKNETEW